MPDTVTRTTISAEAAKKMIAAAEAKATEMKRAMVIAVCDEGGNLKAYSRMDGAPLLSVQIAQDKAWTSVSFGVSTDKWFDFVKDDPPLLHGIVHTPRSSAAATPSRLRSSWSAASASRAATGRKIWKWPRPVSKPSTADRRRWEKSPTAYALVRWAAVSSRDSRYR
jgi:uncharacterized protein GlcG (DUF336 family)